MRLERTLHVRYCSRSVHNQTVYVRRSRPFRYEVGTLSPDRASEYIIVNPEYRRAGLRVDRLQLVPLSDRRDLEARIQEWAAAHGLQVEQFSRLHDGEKGTPEAGKTALDRLLAAQPQDVAQRLSIPADIAQILTRML